MASTIDPLKIRPVDANAGIEIKKEFQNAAADIVAIQKGGYSFGTNETLTGAGAASVACSLTEFVTAGVGDAVTLANGTSGQRKVLKMKTRTGGSDTTVVTPASFHSGSTITFDAVTDVAILEFVVDGWVFVGGTATVA